MCQERPRVIDLSSKRINRLLDYTVFTAVSLLLKQVQVELKMCRNLCHYSHPLVNPGILYTVVHALYAHSTYIDTSCIMLNHRRSINNFEFTSSDKNDD